MKIVISKFDQSFLMAWKCFKSLSALMPKLTPLERKVRIQANQSKPQPDLVLSGELTPRSINQFVNLFSGNFDEGQRMRILNLFFWNMSSNYFSFNCLTSVSILIDLLYCIGSNNMRKSIHFNIKTFFYSHNKLSKIMINTINLYFSFQGHQADWYFLILASWSPLYLFRCQYVVKGLKFNKSFYVLSPKRFTEGEFFPHFGN